MVGGADAGKHQQLRASDCAGAEDHLAARRNESLSPALSPPHSGCAPVLDRDSEDLGPRPHLQVRALHRRPKVGVRRAPPAPPLLEHRCHRHPVLLGRVDIRVGRDPGRFGRLDKTRRDRAGIALLGDVHRPADGAELGRSQLVVLESLEIGQHVVVAPARAAHLPPGIEVDRPSPGEHHRVHRAGPAQASSSGHEQFTTSEVGLRPAAVVPVELRAELFREGSRDLDVRRPVPAPGLQEQHLDVRFLAETGSQRATGGPRTDDHEFDHTEKLARLRASGRR